VERRRLRSARRSLSPSFSTFPTQRLMGVEFVDLLEHELADPERFKRVEERIRRKSRPLKAVDDRVAPAPIGRARRRTAARELSCRPPPRRRPAGPGHERCAQRRPTQRRASTARRRARARRPARRSLYAWASPNMVHAVASACSTCAPLLSPEGKRGKKREEKLKSCGLWVLCLIPGLSGEGDYAANAVLGFHELEATIDVVKREAMGDE
jgi:hypothetical protein